MILLLVAFAVLGAILAAVVVDAWLHHREPLEELEDDDVARHGRPWRPNAHVRRGGRP